MDGHRGTQDDPEPGSVLSLVRRLVAGRAWAGRSALALALMLGAAACTETEFGFGTDPTETARVDLVFEVPGATTSSAVRAEGVTGRVAVDDVLTIDSVDVVIRELQLGRQGTECLFGAVGGDGDGGDGSDCEEFFIQTIVQTLPVDDGTAELLSGGAVAPGTFDRLAFRFNVLEGDTSEELTILGDRGDLQDESVFVAGTFEGEEFEVRLDPDVEVVVSADSPLTLEAEETGRIVLVWDVASWFVDPDDGGIEDPNKVESDAQLEEQVETRILNSLAARLTRE